MSENRWLEVDHYIESTVARADPALEQALQRQDAAGLPAISVSAAQGKLLQLLARSVNAKRILEIGTLAGYSTIWLVRALPADGRLVTLELDPKHAQIARENFAAAGLAERIELREGAALDSLAALRAEHVPPFDFAFIDADKASIPQYFEHALGLSRPGALIVVDNVVRRGALVDAASPDPNVQGVRSLHQLLASDARVDATTIQTVGAKGYDGFLLAVVR